MNPTLLKRTMLASSLALTLGLPVAQAEIVPNVSGPYSWSTDSANFTLLDSAGGTEGGTNDISLLWDGHGYDSSADYIGPGGASNMIALSATQLFARNWALHDIQVFLPGSYAFDTSLGSGNPETGLLTMNVDTGQLGIHMLFDWGSNFNIDIVMVLDYPSAVFGPGIGRSMQNYTTTSGIAGNLCDEGAIINCLWDGGNFGSAGQPAGGKAWNFASADANGDQVMGIPMAAGGPFEYFNANLNFDLTAAPSPVPVPSAALLFIPGLITFLRMASSRKRAGVHVAS